MIRQTHTYAVLELSETAYSEIKRKLEAAGYQHAFQYNSKHDEVIDMHGIAVAPPEPIKNESVSTRRVVSSER